MKTQQDTKIRTVALENLIAMCERVSGMCHRYAVTKVSRSRVHVEYSNPDEYGHEHPMTAVVPCYPSSFSDDEDNPRVVFDILRVLHDDAFGEGWQNFDALLDYPTLWRGPNHKGWRTHREIVRDLGATTAPTADRPDTCVVCDIKEEKS